MKIYTKTGDKGMTSLWDGSRVSKDNIYIDTLGEIDTLSVYIGSLYVSVNNEFFRVLQRLLQDINTHIATPNSTTRQLPFLDPSIITTLENDIDRYTDELPKLTRFILPCSNDINVKIHLCRVQTRKVERYICGLDTPLDPTIHQFINRLSDYFFVLARVYNDV